MGSLNLTSWWVFAKTSTLDMLSCEFHKIYNWSPSLSFLSASRSSSFRATASRKPRGSRRDYWLSLPQRATPWWIQTATTLSQRETPAADACKKNTMEFIFTVAHLSLATKKRENKILNVASSFFWHKTNLINRGKNKAVFLCSWNRGWSRAQMYTCLVPVMFYNIQ